MAFLSHSKNKRQIDHVARRSTRASDEKAMPPPAGTWNYIQPRRETLGASEITNTLIETLLHHGYATKSLALAEETYTLVPAD